MLNKTAAILALALLPAGAALADTVTSCSFDPASANVVQGTNFSGTLLFAVDADGTANVCSYTNGNLTSCEENAPFPSPFAFVMPWDAIAEFNIVSIGLGTSSAQLCELPVTVQPASIPTLSEWGTMLLGLLMAGMAALRLRRVRARA